MSRICLVSLHDKLVNCLSETLIASIYYFARHSGGQSYTVYRES